MRGDSPSSKGRSRPTSRRRLFSHSWTRLSKPPLVCRSAEPGKSLAKNQLLSKGPSSPYKIIYGWKGCWSGEKSRGKSNLWGSFGRFSSRSFYHFFRFLYALPARQLLINLCFINSWLATSSSSQCWGLRRPSLLQLSFPVRSRFILREHWVQLSHSCCRGRLLSSIIRNAVHHHPFSGTSMDRNRTPIRYPKRTVWMDSGNIVDYPNGSHFHCYPLSVQLHQY